MLYKMAKIEGIKSESNKSYFRAFGWTWSLIYVFWSLAYQAGDIIYSIWLSTWVDAIPYYNRLKSDGSTNCIEIIPGQDQDTTRIGSNSDFSFGYTVRTKSYHYYDFRENVPVVSSEKGLLFLTLTIRNLLCHPNESGLNWTTLKVNGRAKVECPSKSVRS